MVQGPAFRGSSLGSKSKGFRVGTAAISQKHANFIQVDQNGRATDVYLLMKEIQRRVSEEFGIKLKIETQLIGFD